MIYKVYIFLGQSNCSGEAPLNGFSNDQRKEKSKVLIWRDSILKPFKTSETNRTRAYSEQKGGLDIQLATLIEQNLNETVIFLKMDEGTTSVKLHWNPSTLGLVTSQYLKFKLMIEAFTIFFAKHYPSDTFVYKALFWNQGEQDGSVLADANEYLVNCGNTFNAIKTLVATPTLPIYDWYLSDLTNVANKAIINTAKTGLRAVHANGGVIYSTNAANGYKFQDTVHYNDASYTLAGQRLYDDLILNGHL